MYNCIDLFVKMFLLDPHFHNVFGGKSVVTNKRCLGGPLELKAPLAEVLLKFKVEIGTNQIIISFFKVGFQLADMIFVKTFI